MAGGGLGGRSMGGVAGGGGGRRASGSSKSLPPPHALSDPSYLLPPASSVTSSTIMPSNSASPQAEIKPYFSHSPVDSQSPASSATEGATPGPAIRPKPSPAPSTQSSSLAPAAVVAPPLSNGYASPMGSGPIGRSIEVPARPKPGRKTAVDEPTSKRKAQNRQAQRNFRQRKLEHAASLETQNQDLRAENQQLQAEIEQLSRLVNESQHLQAKVKRELEELRKRSASDAERLATSMSTMRATQEQLRVEQAQRNTLQRQYEAKAAETEALERKLAAFSRSTSSMLPPALGSPRPQSAQTSTPTPGRLGLKRHSATDGCGNCEETGDCACVDTYIDSSRAGRETSDPLRKVSTMSIHSMLSPQTNPNTRQRRASQALPDLMSDVSCENDALETDFTTFSKNYIIPAVPLSSRPTEASSGMSHADTCGFCTDSSNCLCAEITFDSAAPSTQALDLAVQPDDIASSFRSPGSCPACQANPEQKAFCESLAQERAAHPQASTLEDGRSPKRQRLESHVTIPCADASPLYKRLSQSRESVTYDILYNEFLRSQPSSRRDTGVTGTDPKARQFSAFEADIVEVLASLHRANSISSGSGGSTAIKRSGSTDATRSSGARDRVER